MSSPVEEAMKEVEISESSEESTDSEPHPLAIITSTGVIDLDPNFGSRPSTVVVDDIPVEVAVNERSSDQIPIWDPRVRRANVADVDRVGQLVGWQLDLLLRVAVSIKSKVLDPDPWSQGVAFFDIAPCQLMPNGWRLLMSIEVFHKKRGLPFSLGNLFHSYYMKGHKDESGHYLISACPHCSHFIADFTTNDRG
ncbi:hypothetical protein ACOSQ2_022631 [Xanthoceras sorbifolium]